jgi:hypothetical protein
MTEELRDRWVCWHVESDPPHDRSGKRMVGHFTRPVPAIEAAEWAAAEVDQHEMRDHGWPEECVSTFHGQRKVIEVDTSDGPKRFAVRSSVRMNYRACPLHTVATARTS